MWKDDETAMFSTTRTTSFFLNHHLGVEKKGGSNAKKMPQLMIIEAPQPSPPEDLNKNDLLEELDPQKFSNRRNTSSRSVVFWKVVTPKSGFRVQDHSTQKHHVFFIHFPRCVCVCVDFLGSNIRKAILSAQVCCSALASSCLFFGTSSM